MGVPKSEANDKAIKEIVSKDVYKDIDLIADAKNLKPEKLGTVNKSGVFTYYDKDFKLPNKKTFFLRKRSLFSADV
jgi:hypothetical protein